MSDERKRPGRLSRVVRALGDSKPRWWNRIFASLVAPVLLAAGGAMIGQWAPVVADLVRSFWWSEATAALVENHGQTAIRYSYEVEGEGFSGTRFYFGEAAGRLAEEEIARFQEGKAEEISIFVNPDSPAESVVKRNLSPMTWMAIPLSFALLLPGFVMAGYALLPTIFYWWRRKLRARFMEGVPDLILNSLGSGEPKILFSSMVTAHRGFRLLGWTLFWGLLVVVVLTGGFMMMRIGDERWIWVGGILAPFALATLVLGWMTYRSFRGPQPPGLVFLFDGWRPGNSVAENDKVSVHWMSDPDENDNFRSCRVGLGRWPNGQSFRKWRKNHPDWRDTLVDISQGTVGAHGFDLEGVGRFDGPAMLGEEVHLVMIWQEWDGKVCQTSMYLGELRAS